MDQPAMFICTVMCDMYNFRNVGFIFLKGSGIQSIEDRRVAHHMASKKHREIMPGPGRSLSG